MFNRHYGGIAPLSIGNYGNYGGTQNYIRRTLNPETGERFLTFGKRDVESGYDKHITFNSNMRPVEMAETYGDQNTGRCQHQGRHRGPHGPQDFNRPGFGGPRNTFDRLWQGIGNRMNGMDALPMGPIDPYAMGFGNMGMPTYNMAPIDQGYGNTFIGGRHVHKQSTTASVFNFLTAVVATRANRY